MIEYLTFDRLTITFCDAAGHREEMLLCHAKWRFQGYSTAIVMVLKRDIINRIYLYREFEE